MNTWVLFFVVWGFHGSTPFGTSSVSVEFSSQGLCESGRSQLQSIIPSQKDGYFSFSFCAPK